MIVDTEYPSSAGKTIDAEAALPASGNPVWLSFAEANSAAEASTYRILADWFRAYTMQPHGDLGRKGHVCPYMAQAVRLDLGRMAVSDLDGSDAAPIWTAIRSAAQLFDDMECPTKKGIFRTVVIAFPRCDTPDGIAAITTIQHALRYEQVFNKRMLGFFEPNSVQPGISNRAFRSFRAPVPTIAVRSLVELDAPFVLQNLPMIPVYLAEFGRAGMRRLAAALRQRIADRCRALWSAVRPASE